MKKFFMENDQVYLNIKVKDVTLYIEKDAKSYTERVCFKVSVDQLEPPVFVLPSMFYFPREYAREYLGFEISDEDLEEIYSKNHRVAFKLSATGKNPIITVTDSKHGKANGEYSSWQEAFDAVLQNIKQLCAEGDIVV